MTTPLRIAQVAPLELPIRPGVGGSIAQLVWLLTEELVRGGHDVTLIASGDSTTSARLLSVYPHSYTDDGSLWDWRFHEMVHIASAFERADEFDVIHVHAYHFALPFTRLVRTPVVYTNHVMPNRDVAEGFARYPEVHLVAISDYQRSTLANLNWVGVVHHGIDVGAFTYRPEGGDYLAFLGRVLPRKGPVEAIRVAQRLGMRLVIAGPLDEAYYRSEVAPLVDGRRVVYIGEVDAEGRNRLLGGAAALLFPLTAGEPFGLVAIEAMACGTPVAALAQGAVPELIEEGVTGYYASDVESLADLVPATIALDRARVRRAALERFDYRRMARDYAAVYRRVAAQRGRPR